MANIALVVAGVLVALVMLELIVRRGSLRWENHVLNDVFRSGAVRLFVHDAELGWVPRPGASAEDVHIGAEGLRLNGDAPARRSPPLILAVGDSFTFGNQVRDHETWPAQLETLTSYPVLNGGVSGYGLDQIVLRAESLVAKYHPDVTVVSFIYDDLERCRLSVNDGVAKPYFEIADGQLQRRNVPVPQPKAGLDLFRRLFGYSHVMHMTMDRLAPGYWWKGTPRGVVSVAGGNTLALSKALFSRLGATAQANQTKVLIVAQPESDVSDLCCRLLPELLAFIRTELPSFTVVDAIHPVLRMKRERPEEFQSLFFPEYKAHMTPRGNGLIADLVSRALPISARSTSDRAPASSHDGR